MIVMDTNTIYNIMWVYASTSDDIDLKRVMGIPPRKLQVDDMLADELNDVLMAKFLNVFNSDNNTLVNVVHSTHKGMMLLVNDVTAYDWFTGKRIKSHLSDDLVPLPSSFLQSVVTAVDKSLATVPAPIFVWDHTQ